MLFDGDAGVSGTWQGHLVQELGFDACRNAIGFAALEQLSYSWVSLAPEKLFLQVLDRIALRVLEARMLGLFQGKCNGIAAFLTAVSRIVCTQK